MRISDRQLAKCRANETTGQQILHLLGYLGHYMYVMRGGLGGKQHVLKTLLLQGEMTQRELLELLHTSSAALSEVLGKLEREGFIKRGRSEADKRQLEVSLTEAGKGAAAEMVREEREFEKDSLDILSQEEKVDLLNRLDAIFDHWRKLEKQKKEECPCKKN